MASVVAQQLKQTRAFGSAEQEVVLGLQLASARIIEPWERFLKTHAELSLNQYNVLRILRGSHPAGLPSGEIAGRMVYRDPDVTRLVDRLQKRGLLTRLRNQRDRRVVTVRITEKGLDLLARLDEHVDRYPRRVLANVGPTKLKQLIGLLEQVLSGLGTFP